MKKKSLIIDEKTIKRNKFLTKLIITIALLILCVVSIVEIAKVYTINDDFSNYIDSIARLNSKTVFSIDRIYLYSSADATSNETTKPVWDLNLYQFTDIALYINNRSDEGVSYENTIKELTIDNIKFNNLQSGTPSLYYKNVNDFAKLTNTDENKITEPTVNKVETEEINKQTNKDTNVDKKEDTTNKDNNKKETKEKITTNAAEKPKNKDFLFSDGYTMDNVTQAAQSYLKSSNWSGECIPIKDSDGVYLGMRVIFY